MTGSLRNLVERVSSRRESVESVVGETVRRINETDPEVKAWVCLNVDEARLTARRMDAEGPRGPLAGVPIAVKDLIDVRGLPTRCGSALRDGEPATVDAHCVSVLRELGAIPVGKSVTTEFGYFAPGPTRNPRDVSRTPGGSSSGSAAAVAAGHVPLALGTQTAGSLTRPASYCGVAGFVAAHGVVPTDGIVGLSNSLDSLGLLALTVDDLYYAWTALKRSASAGILPSPRDVRIRWWTGEELADISTDMLSTVEAAVHSMAMAGWSTTRLPDQDVVEALAVSHAVVMAYEAARERAFEATKSDQLSAPLAELLTTGAACSHTGYEAALAHIAAHQSWIGEIFETADAIVGPAAPGVAPEGQSATGSPALSRPWQALGLPVVTVPGAVDPEGLPLGIQVIGHRGGEQQLFEIAAEIEQLLNNRTHAQLNEG